MKSKRFTDEQTAYALRQAAGGGEPQCAGIALFLRRNAVSEATLSELGCKATLGAVAIAVR
jgi:hypothetical protein